MTIKRGGRGHGHTCRSTGGAGDGAAGGGGATRDFTASTTQPTTLNFGSNVTSASTTADFGNGKAVVYLGPANTGTIGTVTVGGVACSKWATENAHGEQGIWVSNSELAAGTKTIAVTASVSPNAVVAIGTGTLTGASAINAAASTASDTFGANATSFSCSSALSIPSGGVGFAFGAGGGGGLAVSGAGTLLYTSDGNEIATKNTTPGNWTPAFTQTGSNYHWIIALAC